MGAKSLEHAIVLRLKMSPESGRNSSLRQTSMSPRYMRPKRSNWRPDDVAVKVMVTRLKVQGGGVYSPTRSTIISLNS